VSTTIRPRRVRFDWEGTPLHWVPGDPQTTHTVNVLHLLLPAGERWFVDVYRQALPLVTDDRLRDDMKGFMGQEAVHSRAHTLVLDHLAAQGIDTTPFTERVDWMFAHLLGDVEIAGRPAPAWLRRAWLRQRLAIIAAIEHFTAVLGMWVLDSPGLDEAGADPVMLDLVRWHGAEEVEHRSVAFDVFEHLAGGYLRRVETMLVSSLAMTYLWVRGTRFFMANDPSHPSRATWRGVFRAGRQGRLPTVAMIARSIPRYLRPSHHPSHEGSTEAALAYLAASPAASRATADTTR
jgi:predicted metal-dependent hydrolase